MSQRSGGCVTSRHNNACDELNLKPASDVQLFNVSTTRGDNLKVSSAVIASTVNWRRRDVLCPSSTATRRSDLSSRPSALITTSTHSGSPKAWDNSVKLYVTRIGKTDEELLWYDLYIETLYSTRPYWSQNCTVLSRLLFNILLFSVDRCRYVTSCILVCYSLYVFISTFCGIYFCSSYKLMIVLKNGGASMFWERAFVERTNYPVVTLRLQIKPREELFDYFTRKLLSLKWDEVGSYGDAARVWNSLPDLVTSAPSVAVFRSRLKTHVFNISYHFPLWLYSACAVTLVALDTIIVLAYILSYSVPGINPSSTRHLRHVADFLLAEVSHYWDQLKPPHCFTELVTTGSVSCIPARRAEADVASAWRHRTTSSLSVTFGYGFLSSC